MEGTHNRVERSTQEEREIETVILGVTVSVEREVEAESPKCKAPPATPPVAAAYISKQSDSRVTSHTQP